MFRFEIGGYMAKLYFRYGAVGSAKTMNLLAVAHNYRQQGKQVMLLKPHLDKRFGVDQIRSRSGLEANADLLLDEDTDLVSRDWSGIVCVLVDEAQFLSSAVIDQLRQLTLLFNLPVICYGLRTDFKSFLFPGSKRLMEVADSIEEVKATCHFCNRKSIFSLRHINGKGVLEGPQIQLGAEECYYPACYSCYTDQTKEALLCSSASSK